MAIPPVNEPKMIPIQEPANMEDQNAEIKMQRSKCRDQNAEIKKRLCGMQRRFWS